MASVDVPVALLGYGTVGAAVNRMLAEGGDEIERATGHRLRVVKALVRDPDKERDFPSGEGVLTPDFTSILEDTSIVLVAEVMGGLEPTGGYVSTCCGRGSPSSARTSSCSHVAARSSSRRRPGPACSSASRPPSALRFP